MGKHRRSRRGKKSLGIFQNARGFLSAAPVESVYGGTIHVYESSAASGPHLWARTVCPVNLNEPDGPTIEAVAHLTLDNARLLRDQLTYLIKHHYQEID